MKSNRTLVRKVRRRTPVRQVTGVQPPPLKAYAVRVGTSYIEVRVSTSPIRTYISETTKKGIKMKGVFHRGGEIVKVVKDSGWGHLAYRWGLETPGESNVVELPDTFCDKNWRRVNLDNVRY